MSQGPAKGKDLLEIESARLGRMTGEDGLTTFAVHVKHLEVMERIAQQLDDIHLLLLESLKG